MYYEVNVAFCGKHFFATAKRSLTDEVSAKTVYGVLCARFSAEDGFEVSISQYTESGTQLACRPRTNV